MTEIAGKDVGTNDLGILAGGLVVLIASFFHWFGYLSYGASAWHVGFLGWFPVLLCVIAAGAVAARIFAGTTLPSSDKAGPNAIILGLAALGAVLILLKLLIGYHGTDRKFGIYLGLIAALVEAYFAYAAFKASGERVPDFKNLGGGSTPPSA